MEGHDYPIEHFKLMILVAEKLKTLSVQLLEHEYSYNFCSSWWFIYQQNGAKYRVVFDGRDRFLTLEVETLELTRRGNNWEEIKSIKIRNGKNIPERIKILIVSQQPTIS